MGRHCKGLQLSKRSLNELEKLAHDARSMRASDVLPRSL
jgi:hypothetical protein